MEVYKEKRGEGGMEGERERGEGGGGRELKLVSMQHLYYL